MSKTLEERQAEIDEIAISTGLCTREQLAEARRLDALSPPEWLAHEISLDYKKTELYAGKIVKDIRLIGNGQEVITFTDGARLLYSVENPGSGADLYSKTEEEFNFDTWKYREEEE